MYLTAIRSTEPAWLSRRGLRPPERNRVRRMASLIRSAWTWLLAGSACTASWFALACPIMKTRTVVPLRRWSGQCVSRPSRDPGIPFVNLGNPPRRAWECAEEVLGIGGGGLGNPPKRSSESAKERMRARQSDSAPLHGGMADFRRATTGLLETAHARPLEQPCALCGSGCSVPSAGLAGPHRRSGAAASPIRRTRSGTQGNHLGRSGAFR